jgi:hypothetical protein
MSSTLATTEEASANVSNTSKLESRKSRMGNKLSASPLKLKIPSAYTPDPWVCDHTRKKNELIADNLVVKTPKPHRKQITESPKKKLRPFLTGVLRASPTKDSNNKCDWRCNHSRKRCVKDINYSLLNSTAKVKAPNVPTIRIGGRRNESWSEIKSVVNASIYKTKKLATRSAKSDTKSNKIKPQQRPLSLKSANKSKPKVVFNKAKLNFKKKLNSIKNKCLSLKSPPKPITLKKIDLVKKGKITLRKRTDDQATPLLDEEYNTLDSIMSEG